MALIPLVEPPTKPTSSPKNEAVVIAVTRPSDETVTEYGLVVLQMGVTVAVVPSL